MRDQRLWTWHLLAGGVIFVFLGLHMAIMHLDSTLGLAGTPGAGPTEWASVVARMRSVAFAGSYVVLLGAALYHGLYGLRNIVFELSPPAAVCRALNVLFWIAGLALFGFGAWVALVAPSSLKTLGG